MSDINMMIARNIFTILKKQKKKQVELAEALETNKQTVSRLYMYLWGKWTLNKQRML